MSIREEGQVNFMVNNVKLNMHSSNFILTKENYKKVKKMKKDEIILIALLDAQNNGDLFFSENEEEDSRAREILDKEIEKLSKSLKK